MMIVARKNLVTITTSLVLLSLYSTTKNNDNVTGIQIVGLDDLPTIKPLGCVHTKRILEGKNHLRKDLEKEKYLVKQKTTVMHEAKFPLTPTYFRRQEV